MSRFHTRTAVCIFVIISLAMIDTCVMALMSSKYEFNLLAGAQQPVSGMLGAPIPEALLPEKGSLIKGEIRIDDDHLLDALLSYEPRYQFFYLDFVQIRGRMWRGALTADGAAPEGEYALRVIRRGQAADEKTPTYTVRLFADRAGYKRSFHSVARRFFGIQPWWAAIALLPAGVFYLFMAFRQSGREEEALQAMGIGPIYKLAKRKTGWEAVFGLGRRHGVAPGDRLVLLDADRRPAGVITADEVHSEYSRATVNLDATIRHDFLVARQDGSEPRIS